MTTVLLHQVCDVLDTLYPLAHAESWDAPGLIVGDVMKPVQRIMCAVDPTPAVVHEAINAGADLLITHHPLYFKAVHEVSTYSHRGAMVYELMQAGCALWVGHTNIDVAYRGTAHAFADQLGLIDQHPLVPLPYRDQEGHDIGIGRVGQLSQAISLRALAEQVAALLPHTELGVQVAGDSRALVRTVATLPGSGDSCFHEVRQCGADVYITSDLRHHPVLDERCQALHEYELRSQGVAVSVADGIPDSARPMIINTPHSAIERSAFYYAKDDIAHALEQQYGVHVQITVSQLRTDPWDFVVR